MDLPADFFNAFYVATPLAYIALACVAAAVTRRWWSGIALSTVPLLVSLIDPIAMLVFGFFGLVTGLPAAMVTGIVLRQVAEPPAMLLGRKARIVALVIGVTAATLTWIILELYYE